MIRCDATRRRPVSALAFCALAILLSAAPGGALELPQRQHIAVVGSSTLFPIVAAVAERFAQRGGQRTPVLEATGTGGGFKRFCQGLGLGTPDIVMASRPVAATEWEDCRSAGVTEVGMQRLGYDGIAVLSARTGPALALSSRDLYLALARYVPDPVGRPRYVSNPYQRWVEIDPALPDQPIRVLGPPPTSGTRDAFVEKVMEPSCAQASPNLAEPPGDCRALREDGAYEEAGENDARLVRRLLDDPGAVGILGFNFLQRNREKLQAASVDGKLPTFEHIASGIYPLSRPLLLYYKQAHLNIVSGLADFLDHLASPGAVGPDGYLVDEGLIPQPLTPRPAVSPPLTEASG